VTATEAARLLVYAAAEGASDVQRTIIARELYRS
jgi:hypothetical protein